MDILKPNGALYCADLLQHFRQHDDEIDFTLQYPAGCVRYEERKVVLDLGRCLLVARVHVEQRPIGFCEPDASEDPIEYGGAQYGRHARLDRVVLN